MLDSGPPNWEEKKAGPEEAPGRLAALNEHYGRLHWGRRRISNHINGRQNRVSMACFVRLCIDKKSLIRKVRSCRSQTGFLRYLLH